MDLINKPVTLVTSGMTHGITGTTGKTSPVQGQEEPACAWEPSFDNWQTQAHLTSESSLPSLRTAS